MKVYLDFEKPIADLEGKIEELKQLAARERAPGHGVNFDDEIARLHARITHLVGECYTRLTPWQKTQVARHPARPHFSDYVSHLITDFVLLAGDRLYGDDKAIVTGLGWFRGSAVAVVGQEKGNDTASRLKYNFGMGLPEGYRKAQRLFDLADRFGLPVISLVDTAGAYPGIGAEERHIAGIHHRGDLATNRLSHPGLDRMSRRQPSTAPGALRYSGRRNSRREPR